jgi:hypothetical protein
LSPSIAFPIIERLVRATNEGEALARKILGQSTFYGNSFRASIEVAAEWMRDGACAIARDAPLKICSDPELKFALTPN